MNKNRNLKRSFLILGQIYLTKNVKEKKFDEFLKTICSNHVS